MSATCEKCGNTGMLPGSKFLDCTSCDTAMIRVGLETWATEAGMKVHPDDLWAIFKAGQSVALEEAIAKLDSINDKAGDRAAYDGDEMTMYETEAMHAFARAIEVVESLK